MAISDELLEAVEPPQGATGDVQVFFDHQVTLIMLSGEIDLALGPELEDAGRDAIDRDEQIRLDATAVSFLDSVGIGFVARITSASHQMGCPLTVVGASRRVRETLELAGLAELVAYTD